MLALRLCLTNLIWLYVLLVYLDLEHFDDWFDWLCCWQY